MERTTIRVYNTMTRQKEEFVPRNDNRVGIYVCGVTPYSHTHLGHARPNVIWDVIKKFLRSQGYETFHVQNFTDVDDKIIARANEEGIPALELSRRFIQEYLDSMDALGVERADLYPKVSEHISDIIAMVEQLIANGHAYEVDGNVFFSVSSFPEYGKLSNQKRDELLEGTRFEVDPSKRDAADFALWKKAKPGEPAWDSPWGPGRPGWHIECSAMSHKYLGCEFDFHGGGSDLVFPHHENEIAQSEAATGETSARYWVHNGMLNLQDTKMSKSLGNFVTVQDLTKRYPKELIRFYLLSTHYRSELEYYEGKLDEMARGWNRLNEAVVNLQSLIGAPSVTCEVSAEDEKVLGRINEIEESIVEALADDFNTAQAIGHLFDLTREINSYSSGSEKISRPVLERAMTVFQEYGINVLGIVREREVQGESLVEPLLDLILEVRQELRMKKEFSLADKLRDRLGELGIVVEDTPHGARWKLEGVNRDAHI
ncbi:MAG: cysteine--tRNA ligase [Firmicutes bacterium]|nr:cysteine--tRNA ligase [Bacillota bacterium]